MSEGEGTVWDAPNQQVVRPDESAPWEEGTGGDADGPPEIEPPSSLDEMTQAQLLEYAQSIGASPANSGMTKDELRASIEAKEAEA